MDPKLARPERPVVVIASQTVGSGDDGLGAVLMRSFVKTLVGLPEKPAAIVFQNGGVLLTVDDSPLLEDLRALEAGGVVLLVCGTCLDWYERRSRLAVGGVSNMHDIASLLLAAPSVIRA